MSGFQIFYIYARRFCMLSAVSARDIASEIESLPEESVGLLREPLEASRRDHMLKGNYAGFRECHIDPDWLLIYAIDDSRLVLTASRTGSHSDLF
jgi:addiction module RelE/StbE family toxin